MSNIYIRFTLSQFLFTSVNHVVELLSIRIVSEVIIDNSRGSSEWCAAFKLGYGLNTKLLLSNTSSTVMPLKYK
jgi:hypothetical protein